MEIVIDLIMGDCLIEMENIPDESIDLILTDPPYGTTACKWDTVIPFDAMWKHLNRIIKPNCAVVLFGSEPFSSALRMSNIKNYKYDWIWEKEQSHTPFNAKYQPLKVHENIVVFSMSACTYTPNKGMVYYPQMTEGKPYNSGSKKDGKHKFHAKTLSIPTRRNNGTRYPKSIQKFNRERGFHATQKPVTCLEYLIRTYTNENEMVLDFTMGSGSTGVACKNLNRNFIGIESDVESFKIAETRINKELS